MKTITRIAAFTGDENIETAISERIQWTGDFIEEHGLTLPNGGTPPDDWASAMFTPEAGLYGFGLRCPSDGLLQDELACESYGLPEGTGHAVFLELDGDAGELDTFCQKICDMSGMDCHIMADEDDGYQIEKTLKSTGAPMDPNAFIALMYDAGED